MSERQPPPKTAERNRRLGAALRANLQRRKARKDTHDDADGETPTPEPDKP